MALHGPGSGLPQGACRRSAGVTDMPSAAAPAFDTIRGACAAGAASTRTDPSRYAWPMDLISTVVRARTTGTVAAAEYDAFCTPCDHDVTTWPSYSVLAGARALRMVTYSAEHAADNPQRRPGAAPSRLPPRLLRTPVAAQERDLVVKGDVHNRRGRPCRRGTVPARPLPHRPHLGRRGGRTCNGLWPSPTWRWPPLGAWGFAAHLCWASCSSNRGVWAGSSARPARCRHGRQGICGLVGAHQLSGYPAVIFSPPPGQASEQLKKIHPYPR